MCCQRKIRLSSYVSHRNCFEHLQGMMYCCLPLSRPVRGKAIGFPDMSCLGYDKNDMFLGYALFFKMTRAENIVFVDYEVFSNV